MKEISGLNSDDVELEKKCQDCDRLERVEKELHHSVQIYQSLVEKYQEKIDRHGGAGVEVEKERPKKKEDAKSTSNGTAAMSTPAAVVTPAVKKEKTETNTAKVSSKPSKKDNEVATPAAAPKAAAAPKESTRAEELNAEDNAVLRRFRRAIGAYMHLAPKVGTDLEVWGEKLRKAITQKARKLLGTSVSAEFDDIVANGTNVQDVRKSLMRFFVETFPDERKPNRYFEVVLGKKAVAKPKKEGGSPTAASDDKLATGDSAETQKKEKKKEKKETKDEKEKVASASLEKKVPKPAAVVVNTAKPKQIVPPSVTKKSKSASSSSNSSDSSSDEEEKAKPVPLIKKIVLASQSKKAKVESSSSSSSSDEDSDNDSNKFTDI